MTGGPFTSSTLTTICACVMAHALAGCAAKPSPKPRADAAAVVLEVVAAPKEGAKVKRFARVPVYDAAPQPAAPAGQFELVDYSVLDDVIVWLEPAGGGDETAAVDATNATRPTAHPRPPLKLDVTTRARLDGVRAASVGQEIVFRNRGSEPVSLYSVSDDNDFELPAIPAGGEARYTVRATGTIEVLADPGEPPVATLYAVPSPWVARTRSGGRVVFDDVTPGSYEAVCWHPRLPGSTEPVLLEPGTVARAALKVGMNVLAEDQP
jgi:hypothetical protein